jgi:hypothetical protein
MNDTAEPTGELVLAQALEACLQAEQTVPGSSTEVVARAPETIRAELAGLIETVHALNAAAATVQPSAEFRSAARARLLQRIGTPASVQPVLLTSVGGSARARASRRWLFRGTAGLAAAALTVTATLTASASALPGDPLYVLKQAQEELSVRLAADEEARALALLRRADARLDEAARLLAAGRAEDAATIAEQYDSVVDQATATLVTSGDDESGRAAVLETKLQQHQERLEAILARAPEPAQGGLQQALLASERGQALAANPHAAEQAARREAAERARAQAQAQPQPQAQSTPQPTEVPQPLPTRIVPTTVARDARRHEDESRFADTSSAQGNLARVHPPEEDRPPAGPGRLGIAPDTGEHDTAPARAEPDAITPREQPPTVSQAGTPELRGERGRGGPPAGVGPPDRGGSGVYPGAARPTPTPTPTSGGRRGAGGGG